MDIDLFRLMLLNISNEDWIQMLRTPGGVSSGLTKVPAPVQSMMCVKLNENQKTMKLVPFLFNLQNNGIVISDQEIEKVLHNGTIYDVVRLLAKVADDNFAIKDVDDQSVIDAKIDKVKQLLGGLHV